MSSKEIENNKVKKKDSSSWGEPPYYCEICGKPGHWSGYELHGPMALCWWHDLLQFTDTLLYLLIVIFLIAALIIIPGINLFLRLFLIVIAALSWRNLWRFLS